MSLTLFVYVIFNNKTFDTRYQNRDSGFEIHSLLLRYKTSHYGYNQIKHNYKFMNIKNKSLEKREK